LAPSAGDSLASLYHLDAAGWIALEEKTGEVWRKGWRSRGELERRARVEVVNARRIMMKMKEA
jgi:hypothetical protein